MCTRKLIGMRLFYMLCLKFLTVSTSSMYRIMILLTHIVISPQTSITHVSYFRCSEPEKYMLCLFQMKWQ